MSKESHLNIEMIIAVLLFSAVYSQKKTEFGTLTACVNKNQSLTVDCFYPSCDSTPFECNIYDVEGNTRKLIGSSEWEKVKSDVSYLDAMSGVCRLIIKNHARIYLNKTKIYACHLSRRTSEEEKTLTVQYNKRKDFRKTRGSQHNTDCCITVRIINMYAPNICICQPMFKALDKSDQRPVPQVDHSYKSQDCCGQ